MHYADYNRALLIFNPNLDFLDFLSQNWIFDHRTGFLMTELDFILQKIHKSTRMALILLLAFTQLLLSYRGKSIEGNIVYFEYYLSIYLGTYNLAIHGYITISYHYLVVTSGTYARGTGSCTYQ